MSYYEPNTPVWPNTRPGWNGTGATTNFQRPHSSNPADLAVRYASQMKIEDTAFGSQLDEVDRAVDNLVKSGKMFPTQRRESMPVLAPRFPVEHVEPRMVPVQQIPARHFTVQDYDMRNQPAASLQKFYAAQRFQPRPSEAEQMMQAQRRLAAQRERELRNYHQEQQFNRSMSTRSPIQGKQINAYQGPLAILAEMSTYGKDRVMSPGSMTEEERRELIARQRAALYGGGDHPAQHEDLDENGVARQMNNGPGSVSGSTRGPSPLSFDPFGLPSQNGNEPGSGQVQGGDHHQTSATTANSPSRSRTNSASSPSSKSANFNLFDGTNPQAQGNNRTSASSPGGSPPRVQTSRGPNGSMAPGGVAPIGTRPASQTQATNPALSNKQRSTTPLPSPLGYGGFTNEDPFNGVPKERSASAASNASGANGQDPANIPNWGSKVWGGKSIGSVTSVWAMS